MADDIAKIISSLDVDYQPAIRSAKEFAVSLEKLDQQLKQVKQSATSAAEQINKSFSNTGKQIAAESEMAIQTIPQQTQKMTQVTQQQLAKLEASLVSTSQKLRSLGITTPTVQGAIGEVRGLRDQLVAGKALNEEQTKYVAQAQQIAMIEANNARIIEQQVKNKANLRTAQEELATSQQRAAVTNQAYLDKELANAKMTLPALEAKLAQMQRSVEISRLSNTPLKEQLTLMRRQIVELRTKIGLEGKITKEEAAQVAQLQKQAAVMKQNIAMIQTDIQRQLDPTGKGRSESMWERRGGWFLVGGMMFGAVDAMRQMVGVTGEIEEGMITIGRVMEDATFSTETMRKELLQLGKDYGMVWSDVEDIAIRWAQAGYNMSDSLKLTEASLLALNTAELDARYATEGLIAIMAQWGLTADQLPDIIDKINKVADDYAVTSQDLVDGLNRSSGAARVMGLSIEETIGILTTMREATGRTGKEIGNALNSILSFVQREKAINVFESLGIQVFADEAKTQFRSVMEIFNELAARWQDNSISEAAKNQLADIADAAGLYTEEMAEATGTMDEYREMTEAATAAQGKFTDIEQRDAAQAAAGIYRRNYLIALLQNWSKVYDVLNTQEQAHGYSLKENERTMESYTKRVQALKTALAELAVAIGEAGVLDALKGIVDGSKEAVEVLSALPDEIQKAIVIFGALTGALATVQLTSRVFFGVGLGTGIKNLAALAKGMSLAEASTLGLGAALRALVTTPWGIAIGVISIAIGILAVQLKKAHEHAEELRKLPETLREFKNTEKLVTEYENLSAKINKTTEETERLNQVKQELGSIFPEVVEKLGEEGEVLEINNEYLRERIRLEREELELKKQKLAESFGEKGGEEIERAQKELKEVQEMIELYEDVVAAAERGETPYEGKALKNYLEQARGNLRRYRLEANQLQQEMINMNREFDNQASAVLETSDAFRELDDSITRGLVSTLRELSGGDMDKVEKQILRLADSKETANAINEVQAALEKLNETGANAESIEALDSVFQNLISTLMDGEVSLGLTSDAAGTLAYALLDTIDPTASAQIKLHHLNQTMNDVREGSISMANAASRASSILASNISADVMKCISAYKQQIRTLADVVEAQNAAMREAHRAARAKFGTVTNDPIINRAVADYMYTAQQNISAYYGSVSAIIAIANRPRGVSSGGGYKSAGSSGGGYKSAGTPSRGSPSKSAKDTAKAAEQTVTWLDKFRDSLETAIPASVLYRFEQLNKALTSLDWSTPHRQLVVLGREFDYLQTKMSKCIPTYGDLSKVQSIAAQQAKLLAEEIAKVAPSTSELNKNILQQRSYLEKKLAEAQKQYSKAKNEAARQEALTAIQETMSRLEEVWALYDRSNQMAWENRIKMIELATTYAENVFEEYRKAATKEIRAIQEELEAMDAEDALKKHNDKLAELQEERRYHELRTGKEHTKRIKEIDKQIQEEQESWNKEQRKKELQDRIDFLEEQQRLIDEQLVKALASLATYDSKWYEKFKKWADEAVKGWRAGKVESVITGELKKILETLKTRYGVPIDIEIPKAHTGAKVESTGLAMLLKGERVLSPQLTVSFDRLANALLKTNIPNSIGVGGGLEQKLDKLLTILETKSGIQINGHLINMEQVGFEDQADMQIFNRSLARQIRSLSTAKG